MNAMHNCSLALFLDLCFSLMKTWKSYDPPGNITLLMPYFPERFLIFLLEVTVIPPSFNAGIQELFENVEKKFGRTLVSHAVR